MYENGLIAFAGGSLTLPALMFFAWVSFIFASVAYKLTEGLSQPKRFIKFMIGAVGLSVCVLLIMKSLGWWV